MVEPKRGQIWRVKLGHPNRSTELWGEHPCLVVSENNYHDASDGLTIVPLTTYEERRERVRSLWGVTITNQEDVALYRENRDHLRAGEGLRIHNAAGEPYRSIIDCGQIRTVFKKQDGPANQLCWDRCHGQLLANAMIQVEAALQVIIGGDTHFNPQGRGTLCYPQGNVLLLNLQGAGTDTAQPRPCLVVSSTGVDAIRERIMVTRDDKTNQPKPLGQRTVVPLIPAVHYDANEDVGIAKVSVYPNGSGDKPHDALALCQEIYTVDWRSRETTMIGTVHHHDMDAVRLALRDYLNLPLINGTSAS